MVNTPPRLLITAVGNGATWNGDAAGTPWSVYITREGSRVVGGGGKYPTDNPASQLLMDNLAMDDAIVLAERLKSIVADLGISCEVELLGDA